MSHIIIIPVEECINITDVPDVITSWTYPPMYRYDVKGVPRVWQGGYLHPDGIYTIYGVTGSDNLIRSEPYKVDENSSGRDLVEQIALELRSRYEVKYRKEGYRYILHDSSIGPKKPMLANDWKKRPKSFRLYYPVAVQPKLDGIRCLVKYDRLKNRLVYRSRTHKEYDFGYLFDEELEGLLPYLEGGDVEFDGELYIHGEPLNVIASVVALKTTEAGLSSLKGKAREEASCILEKRRRLLRYNVFTTTEDGVSYEERRSRLERAFGAHPNLERVTLVPSYVVNSEHELVSKIDSFIDEHGFEGGMVYKMIKNLPYDLRSQSYYRPGRSWNLIKVKRSEDEEMTIVDIKCGKGKAAELAGARVVDEHGITHEVNFAMNDSFRKDVLSRPEYFIGKKVTVKYFGRTPDGKLRHANIIVVRDYE